MSPQQEASLPPQPGCLMTRHPVLTLSLWLCRGWNRVWLCTAESGGGLTTDIRAPKEILVMPLETCPRTCKEAEETARDGIQVHQ